MLTKMCLYVPAAITDRITPTLDVTDRLLAPEDLTSS
jgi:hypothetical protein